MCAAMRVCMFHERWAATPSLSFMAHSKVTFSFSFTLAFRRLSGKQCKKQAKCLSGGSSECYRHFENLHKVRAPEETHAIVNLLWLK